MKAEIIKQTTLSGVRNILANELPLHTPYVVQFFPVYACNFKCNYCIHSIPFSGRGYVADKKNMDIDMYKKCVDNILEFPDKVKMLRFAATGEPLLHSKIAEMVEYAAQKKAADSIEIVTNGALLTKELSDKLINAGLDWLRISVQGVTSQKYKDVCGIQIDFDEFLENIKYFYDNKKETNLYIKVIDMALDEGDEKRFYEIFGDFCDKISVEYLIPATSKIDYSQISKSDFNLTQNGVELSEDIQVCPQPFYMMQINPDGNIVPCCAMETAYVSGNCKEDSLVNIWNSERMKKFQNLQLKKEKYKNKVCGRCQSYKYGVFKEDILDNDTQRLLRFF